MPTKVACFLDTNVLLYAALGRLDEPKKFQISRNLVANWDFGLSTQVLSEFFVNSQRRSERRSQRPLTAAEATEFVIGLNDRPCVAFDRSIVHVAIAYAHRYQISYWDAAIVAAAERLESPILYTEDLNHGQRYATVRVMNPFIST